MCGQLQIVIFIIRTCGLYGRASSEGKGNFVTPMLRRSKNRQELSIVDDQHCMLVYAVDVAVAIARLIETEHYGFCTTRHELPAHHAVNPRLPDLPPGKDPHSKCGRFSSSEYPQKAKRPGYSEVHCGKLAGLLGSPLPTWEDLPAGDVATSGQHNEIEMPVAL